MATKYLITWTSLWSFLEIWLQTAKGRPNRVGISSGKSERLPPRVASVVETGKDAIDDTFSIL
jgi:hypothetical protein